MSVTFDRVGENPEVLDNCEVPCRVDCVQEFIDGAGDAGLVLISLGTMAKFGERL